MMSLLALTVIRSGDIQGRIAANDLENARIEALAEAGINIALVHLIVAHRTAQSRTDELKTNGDPTFCQLPGATAAIDIENEGGKVDLNAASPDLLIALIEAAGIDKGLSRTLAGSIIQYRSNVGNLRLPPADNSSGPDTSSLKHALFETTYELEQVPGMTADLFQALRPYLTVYSRSPGIDPAHASRSLIAMLSGESYAAPDTAVGDPGAYPPARTSLPQEFVGPSNANSFLVRAEVLGSRDATFAREAIVEFPPEDGHRVVIREWRRGERRFASFLKALPAGTPLPPC